MGEIVENERDMGNVTGAFSATPAFASWRVRFERKSALAGQIEAAREEDESLLDAFDVLEGETASPALRLVDETGMEHDFGLLYVEGDRAGFRLL